MFDLRYLRINSKYYQWIGAFIGLYFGGIIGAIVVFFLVGKLVKLNSGGLTYELALLNLSILLIKSDGNVDSREIEYVRSFFVKNFGKERANFLFKEIKKKICRTVNAASDAPYASYELCLEYNENAHKKSITDLKDFLYKYAK